MPPSIDAITRNARLGARELSLPSTMNAAIVSPAVLLVRTEARDLRVETKLSQRSALQAGLIQSKKPTRLVVGRSVSVKLSFQRRERIFGAD
jgi:hypothetical protein